MSYKVLARKWRPRNFEQVVGQTHVVRALVNALTHDRMHHAYLFTGTRGVGKTTLARVLAKALNCEQGMSAEPCGQCGACQDIDAGRFVDLIEVDAASRTGVDDTRELLENVQYAPTRGRFKVYLIDEVHMFSKSSFNALLKTLEEPPPHVKFLLATTDPQQVPVTVLSRCLQFNLKRLIPAEIENQLQHILDQESISYQKAALLALAKAADGSLRDALSLLDQAIVFGNGEVSESVVHEMLGCVAQEPVLDVLRALLSFDAGQVLEQINAMHEFAPDYSDVLQRLLSHLHQMALAQQVPSLDIDPEIHDLANQTAPEDIQLFYQIGLIGQRDLPLAPDPKSGFEMVLLRMLAFRPASGATTGQSSAPQAKTTPAKVVPTPRVTVPQVPKPAVEVEPHKRSLPAARKPVERVQAPIASSTDLPKNGHALSGSFDQPWSTVVEQLALDPMTRQLALNVVPQSLSQTECLLQITAGFANINPKAEQSLSKAIEDFLGRSIKVRFEQSVTSLDGTPAALAEAARIKRQQDAEDSIQNNQTVRAILDAFDGHIVPGSVHPIDS